MINSQVIIIGAGAAGLMCGIEAAKRGNQVIIIEHANKPGKKILMSGGGRCNFTNYYIEANKYLSNNPHFVKSALSRYTQWDFINLVEKHKITYHEKTLGQLFCDNKSKDILNMLLNECQRLGAKINLNESVISIKKVADRKFNIKTNHNNYICNSLVIASGGLSIPTLGASPFGYKIAEQFGIKVLPTRAGLVPFTLHNTDKQRFAELSGIANASVVSSNNQSFAENILFTHRGLSGPAILQISSYWQPGNDISINLLPDQDLEQIITNVKHNIPQSTLKNLLAQYFAKRLINTFLPEDTLNLKLASINKQQIKAIADKFHKFTIKPNGTEGYRTAEVTLGGVDCNEISSKTMQANKVPGLYFIGEVLDVSGWLGGYNFQWAWSSGWAAGQEV